MKIKAVSIAYMNPEIMAASVARFYESAGVLPVEWVLVDNHWPLYGYKLDWRDISNSVRRLAKFMMARVAVPERNLGGHGGLTFGLKTMNFKDNDLILNYDLDSWPITHDWLFKMMQVMEADPSLGWVALMPERISNNPGWKLEDIGGHRVAFRSPTEMWNVTLFRGKMFKEGMLADSKYYGFVETAMERKATEMGLRHGWLYDVREGPHFIPHPEIYNKYKWIHARKDDPEHFPGSFEEYLKEKGVTI
jgi:hypothetical protein